MSVALSRLLRQLPDALLLFLAGFVRPHQPNLENRKQPSETQETDNSTNIRETDGAMASTSVEHDSAPGRGRGEKTRKTGLYLVLVPIVVHVLSLSAARGGVFGDATSRWS